MVKLLRIGILLSICISIFYLTSTKLYAQVIVIHGGAGTILKKDLSSSLEHSYRTTLTQAVEMGYSLLEEGRTSEAVVVEVIKFLEDSPLFNAGKGAVLNANGKHELDASIMRGNDLMAGAVAGVRSPRNPILAAQAVMNKSNHVMLSGLGAEHFIKEQNIQRVHNKYFRTEKRYLHYKRVKKSQKELANLEETLDGKYGTVGCLALDLEGNLCAGTSTGGMTYKRYGRVGDSPIIGAGTYADNRTCAISCTGHGEYYIRLSLAKSISDRQEHLEENLQTSCDNLIHKQLKELGGTGGVIALNTNGDITFSFNTKGMYRASKNKKELQVKIYEEE